MVQRLASPFFAVSLVLSCIPGIQAAEGDKKPSNPPEINVSTVDSSADATLEQGLDWVVTVDFEKVAVNDLVKFLEQRQIHARADEKALEDAGVAVGDSIFTLQASGISLRAALDELLESHELTFYVRDGRVVITTRDDASTRTIVRVYPVNDLIHRDEEADKGPGDYDSLIDLITTIVRPSTWDEVGGPGSISPFQGTLVVAQTYAVHDSIRGVLAALRESRVQQRQHASSEPICAERPLQVALIKQLAQKSSLRGDFKFANTPLKDAVARIGKHFELPIVLKTKALEDAGVDDHTPVTCDLRDVSPQMALETMLGPIEATWIIGNEMVQVTTKDDASTEMITYIYPVAELIEPAAGKVGAGGRFDQLIEVITSTIGTSTWDEVGGPGAITPFPNTSSLAVSQTRAQHEEISRLLGGLRQARTPQPAAASASVPAPDRKTRSSGMITKVYQLDSKFDPKTVAMLVQGIEPESWERSGVQVRTNGNQLYVRHSREVHRRIDEILRNARPTSSGRMGGGMGMM